MVGHARGCQAHHAARPDLLGTESLPLMTEVPDLVHAWLPQIQDVRVPGASHFLQLENALAVAEGLRAFFKANPVPAQGRV